MAKIPAPQRQAQNAAALRALAKGPRVVGRSRKSARFGIPKRRRRSRHWHWHRNALSSPGLLFLPDCRHVASVAADPTAQALVLTHAWCNTSTIDHAIAKHGATHCHVTVIDGVRQAPADRRQRIVPISCVGDIVVAAALLYAEIARDQPAARFSAYGQRRGSWLGPDFGALYFHKLAARWTKDGLRATVRCLVKPGMRR